MFCNHFSTILKIQPCFRTIVECFIKKMCNQYESKKQEIDGLVNKIVKRLENCDPLTTLQLATYRVMQPMVNKVSEFQLVSDSSTLVRFIEYVQSIFVSCLSKNRNTDEQYINETLELIQELYNKNLDFIFYWADENLSNSQFNEQEINYIFESTMVRFVRGNRYQFQQIRIIESLIRPHAEEVEKLFGMSVDVLFDGLHKLEYSLSSGKIDAFQNLLNICDSYYESDHTDNKYFYEQYIQNLTTTQLVEKCFGYDLYDVKKVTNWSDKFIDCLSLSLGKSSDFLDQSLYCGWPMLDLPVQKKPFIKIDGIAYCFDYYNFFDNFYRIIQKNIREQDRDYVDKWSKLQQEASESLVADLFKKILPESNIYVGNYYPDGEHRKQLDENDILIVFESCLIIVEVKAGSFSYTPAIKDLESHRKSFNALIKKADNQCIRTKEYITNCDHAIFYDSNKNNKKEKFSIDKGTYKTCYLMCVTIDNFNAFEAKIEKTLYKEYSGETIAISVDDLDVYAEYFDSPLIFLHFLKHRVAATKVPSSYLNDELDHLGLYIAHNAYECFLADFNNMVIPFGYREKLDSFFAGIHNRTLSAAKPKQEFPHYFEKIVLFLSKNRIANRLEFSLSLLELDCEARKTLERIIDEAISIGERQKKEVPFGCIFSGDVFYCYLKDSNAINLLNERLRKKQTYAYMKSLNIHRCWQLTMSLSETKELCSFECIFLNYENFIRDGFSYYEINSCCKELIEKRRNFSF